MAQDCKIGVLGAGPAGCCCAYFLKNDFDVTLIDYKSPLKTILPTGGGRCNFAHAEFDFRELAKNYPRGEKFLYSIFAKFSTSDTLNLFEELGLEYYIQEDNRIFPVSNSSVDVREKFLAKLKGVTIKQEKGLRIEQAGEKIKLVTDMNSYLFDALVVSTGGHGEFDIIKRIGIDVVPTIPSLVGLKTKEDFSTLAGNSISNVVIDGDKGDILFTHKGISGPLIYKISSINIHKKYPYKLYVNLLPEEIGLQDLLNNNPHKQIDNLLDEFLPKRVVKNILDRVDIDNTTKCHKINGKQRDMILDKIYHFDVTVTGVNKDGEVVMAGGVDLNGVNPQTLESKKVPNIYFTGEVLNIDGFCGGFNLQNCWSTAFVVAEGIKNKYK